MRYPAILPTQYMYLSPAHFLIGEPLTQLPSVDYTNVKCNRFFRWQTYQQHLQHFLQLWSSDYLQELQQRQRWQRTSPNPQSGDVVLQREDNTTLLHRPIAVNTNVHRGSDGIVRMVILRNTKGTFRRPTTKMCPLSFINSEL